MTAYVLPTTVYQPPPQVRREARVTLIEDELQVNIPSFHMPSKLTITSPLADDVPTPRAVPATNTPATDATSVVSSMWSDRSSKSSYDSLYDVTDSEGEEVPLKLSASVKKHVDKERSRYPSLVIPSPSQWPSIHKQQPSCAIGLSPAPRLGPSHAAFAVWQAQRLRVPSGTSTPSLDGSLTSEELALSSCPSTPDLATREELVNEWEPPIQLHPDAFETLHQLSPEDIESEVVETVVEVPEEAAHEMKEILKCTPVRLDFALLAVNPEEAAAQDPVSALSVPSPGGFFSSLAPVAAQTWAIRTPEPSTSVAENFYDVPWRAIHPSERSVFTTLSPASRGPPTAIKATFSPIEEVEVAEITDVCQPSEYNEEYQEKLKQSALAHFERTKGWLDDQVTMLRKSSDAPSTPDMGGSPISSSSPSKKSVRFAPDVSPSSPTGTNKTSMVSLDSSNDEIDTVFFEGFRSILQRSENLDAFTHRQTRLETVHVGRRNFSESYRKHLNGSFEISTKNRPSQTRPISTMLPARNVESVDEEFKETLASVERERQVLEQVEPAAWELQALAYLRGGRLLTDVIDKHVKSMPHAQILDFGGKLNCDWAWRIAVEYPKATVHTTFVGEPQILSGPANQSAVEVEKPFALPFADNTFDLISARSLQSMLKTDETDLTLAELHRVLKPDGYLDYTVIDALICNASRDSWAQVMNAEFGIKLHSRGYDKEPTKQLTNKLQKAGFGEIKRAFKYLPMADVSPKWRDAGRASHKQGTGNLDVYQEEDTTHHFKVEKRDENGEVILDKDGQPIYHAPPLTGSSSSVASITSLYGSRVWEQWACKLARETGDVEAEQQMLEQVCGVLEEGGRTGNGFTCLMGYARK